MSRKVALARTGAFGTDLPQELALFENAVTAKLRADDAQEFGPLTNVSVKTSTYNARPWDLVPVNPTGGAVAVILPDPSSPLAIGSWIGVKNDSASGTTVTVQPVTSTIDGAASFLMTTARQFQWFYSTGAEWKAGPSSGQVAADTEIRVSVSTDQNDYAPTGWSGARYVLLNVTATIIITGFSASVTQRRKTLIHVGTEEIPLGLFEESPSSAAANRIITPTPNDVYMLKNWAQEMWYDTIASRWRLI